MNPEFYNELLKAGLTTVVVVLVFGFLILLVKTWQPMIAQMVSGFETAQRYSDAQHKGLELLTDRIQRALEREEASNDALKAQVLEYTRLIAKMETELHEQKRLREVDLAEYKRLRSEDLKRISELETGSVTDHKAIEDLQKQLKTRAFEIEQLNIELEAVKRDRDHVKGERDERDAQVTKLREEMEGLKKRLGVQEEATKGMGGGPPPPDTDSKNKEK